MTRSNGSASSPARPRHSRKERADLADGRGIGLGRRARRRRTAGSAPRRPSGRPGASAAWPASRRRPIPAPAAAEPASAGTPRLDDHVVAVEGHRLPRPQQAQRGRGPRPAGRPVPWRRWSRRSVPNSSSMGAPRPTPRIIRPPVSRSRVVTSRASFDTRRRATGVTIVPSRMRPRRQRGGGQQHPRVRDLRGAVPCGG